MPKNSYTLIDSGELEKIEQVGPFKIIRPAAGAVWKKSILNEWTTFDARFERFSNGKGKWHINNPEIKNPWKIHYGGLELQMELTSFGHIGLFPEQAKNWSTLREICSQSNAPPLKVLNLFAYTGGSTLACALGGAEAVHLDASKTSVNWAKMNADLNGLQDANIRYLVDDVMTFVRREGRRKSKYDGIILDPPSFGRGTKNQVWKIEEHMNPLLDSLGNLMSENFQFLLLSSHSEGFTPLALENLSRQILAPRSYTFHSGEMVTQSETNPLPAGSSVLAVRKL